MNAASSDTVELSIAMPCLNEAQTLAVCIRKGRRFLETSGVIGEIVVADNCSTDEFLAPLRRLKVHAWSRLNYAVMGQRCSGELRRHEGASLSWGMPTICMILPS